MVSGITTLSKMFNHRWSSGCFWISGESEAAGEGLIVDDVGVVAVGDEIEEATFADTYTFILVSSTVAW